VSQLDLFDAGPDPVPDVEDEALAAAREEAAALLVRVPPRVRFGTSSWAFPGWRGLVYPRAASETALARDGLREYAKHPLLRTVGIDRSYYAPIPDDDLRHYAAQLPPGFLACAKAPASVTSADRPGRRGEPNPDFMSPARLVDELIAPFDRNFRAFTGPFILEFPPVPRGGPDEAAFLRGLDRLLGALPGGFQYAVELRNRDLLTPAYAAVLAAHGAGHVYSYWSAMPMPARQADVVPLRSVPFVVIRLLLAPGTRYEQQRDAFRPFNAIKAPDLRMRADVVALARGAAALDRPVFVLVNNKAEGSSPLTVVALARMLAEDQAGRA
jgi:uncharacterized protein YecE (DUF72 family)